MKITNNNNLPLSIALWLATDEYDGTADPLVISATGLLKPIKSMVLSSQIQGPTEMDLADLIPSRLGTAIHSSIEFSWNQNQEKVQKILKSLGVPSRIAETIEVNKNMVFMEQRQEKEVLGYKVTGKFDFVIDGTLEDFKSTGTYGWINKSNVDSYIKQGSIYRWLNPELITSDIMKINYIFTDWSKGKVVQDPKYPKSRIIQESYPLMSLEETQSFVERQISQFKYYLNHPDKLPECTKEELWQGESVFKYYKDPSKVKRATKNFDNMSDAQNRLIKDGSIGIVKEVKSPPKRCNYCNGKDICQQAQQYIRDGVLI